MSSAGYIYAVDWDRFQHYKDRRPVWIKNYIDLVDNDRYLELTGAQRALLHGIWMLLAVTGNGRLSAGVMSGKGQRNANVNHLAARLQLRKCSLEPLIQAGFIEVRASKAASTPSESASAETEGSKEPKRKKRGVLAAKPPARPKPFQNGKHRDELEEEELAAVDFRSLLKNLNIVKPMP